MGKKRKRNGYEDGVGRQQETKSETGWRTTWCLIGLIFFLSFGGLWWFRESSSETPVVSAPVPFVMLSRHEQNGVPSFELWDGTTEKAVGAVHAVGGRVTFYLGASLAALISREELFQEVLESIRVIEQLHGGIVENEILFIHRKEVDWVDAHGYLAGTTRVSVSPNVITMREIDRRHLRPILAHELSHANTGDLQRIRAIPDIFDEGIAYFTEFVTEGENGPRRQELLRNRQELYTAGALASLDGSITKGIDDSLQPMLAADLFLTMWEKDAGSIVRYLADVRDGKIRTWDESRQFCRSLLESDHPLFSRPVEGMYALQLYNDAAPSPAATGEGYDFFRRGKNGELLPAAFHLFDETGEERILDVVQIQAVQKQAVWANFPPSSRTLTVRDENGKFIRTLSRN